MIGLLLGLDRNCAAFTRRQRQGEGVVGESRRDLVVPVHPDLHDQVGGFRRAGEAFEDIAFVRHRSQNHLFVLIVGLLLGLDGYYAAFASRQLQGEGLVGEGRRDLVVLIHRDLHDQVGGFRRAGEAFEDIAFIRRRRQRNLFVPVVGFLLGLDRNRAARAGGQRQSVGVEVEGRGDVQIFLHHNFDRRVGRGYAAAEALEGVSFVRHGRQRDHVAVLVGFLFGADGDASFPYRRDRAGVLLLDELGHQSRGVRDGIGADQIRRLEVVAVHSL